MSQQEANFVLIQREKRPSSNILTAWQIYSTLNNMEDFLKLIEQFEAKKEQLENILPFIHRIKRIQEEKEFFLKQIMLLGKFIYPLQLNQNQQSLKAEKNTVQKGFQLLSKIKNDVINLNLQRKQNILALKQRFNQANKKRERDIDRKQHELSLKLSQTIEKKILQIQDKMTFRSIKKIKNQSLKLQRYFVNEYINSKQSQLKLSDSINSFKTSQILKSQLKEQNSQQSLDKLTFLVNSDQIQNQLQHEFKELGQIKCKLFSLQDKKRKITVKNLIMNKIPNSAKQPSNENLSFFNRNKKFKLITNYSNNLCQGEKQKNKQRKKNGIIGSFLSIFSNDDQDEQQIGQIKNKLSKKEQQCEDLEHQKQLSNSQKKLELRLNHVDDKEIRLKIAEINAQILQLGEQIKIMVSQNILDRVLCSIMKLKSTNEELRSYIQELKRVIQVIRPQNKIESPSKLNLQQLKNNQQINFFTTFIQQRLITRQALISFLFTNIIFSISVTKKYLTKRHGEIKQSFENLIQSQNTKQKKIKTIQTLQSKPQFQLIYSELESISCEINKVIQKKLAPLQKLLKDESFQKRKQGQSQKDKPFILNQQIQANKLQSVLSLEMSIVEKIIFQKQDSSTLIYYKLLFDSDSELIRKILDIFY